MSCFESSAVPIPVLPLALESRLTSLWCGLRMYSCIFCTQQRGQCRTNPPAPRAHNCGLRALGDRIAPPVA